MSEDEKLAADESGRIARHEEIKDRARDQIQSEVTSISDPESDPDRPRIHEAARAIRSDAISETMETREELARGRIVARISQVIDYIFYLIYGIIALEIIFDLLGARESSGFKQTLNAIAAPLVAPFRGLMPEPSHGAFRLRLSYLAALIVYVLVHLAINGLLRLFVHKKTSV